MGFLGKGDGEVVVVENFERQNIFCWSFSCITILFVRTNARVDLRLNFSPVNRCSLGLRVLYYLATKRKPLHVNPGAPQEMSKSGPCG